MNFTTVGTWWNDKDIELIKLDDERIFALNGWNGEAYTDCWECLGEFNTDASDKKYTLRPVFEADDEEETSFTTIAYTFE